MPSGLRRLLVFAPPFLVGALDAAHPILRTPVYDTLLPRLPWWMTLHFLNLVLFALLGLSGYLLLAPRRGFAAKLGIVALALFVPLYVGFDALAGIGTGSLVALAHAAGVAAGVIRPIIDGFFLSPAVFVLAVAGSMMWGIAMLAAAVAYTDPSRRRIVGIAAVLLFVVIGWARSNLVAVSPGFDALPAWWFVTIGMGVVTFVIATPRVPATLFVLAGALFGATHVPPAGSLGMLCFLGAAWCAEFSKPFLRAFSR
jgi:hypothetical protein